jgi:hypothetical protein
MTDFWIPVRSRKQAFFLAVQASVSQVFLDFARPSKGCFWIQTLQSLVKPKPLKSLKTKFLKG